MKTYCCSCAKSINVKLRFCPECGHDQIKAKCVSEPLKNVVESCCHCGGRARPVALKRGSRHEVIESKILCFYCYHKHYSMKGVHVAKDANGNPIERTLEEKLYYNDIRENYLKPLFYGDPINEQTKS